ncbi:MAG: glycerol-3-phosphate 1-O-acyltransferase PlsY [Verrucomicrobiota bacterium]
MLAYADYIPLAALIGYVIGSTPFGFLAGKMKGIDIREHGSGNIGATNVLRTLGKSVGYPVFLLDVLKGVVPVLIAQQLTDNSLTHIIAAIATILGHNYTFWLKFKGGKGIATTAGTMAPLIPIPLVVALSLWAIFLFATRYVSVASIVAAISIPISQAVQSFLKHSSNFANWDKPLTIFGLVLCILAVWKHRGNIQRLRNGTENRFGKKKTTNQA